MLIRFWLDKKGQDEVLINVTPSYPMNIQIKIKVCHCSRMVRNYKQKRDRKQWSKEAMRNAISAVLEKKMGYYLAAKTYSVPQTTLEKKIKQARGNKNIIQKVKIPLGPKSPIFSDKEAELVEYLKEMESRLFGFTTVDLKSLVYQLATKNKKNHPFNDDKGKAGKIGYLDFKNVTRT